MVQLQPGAGSPAASSSASEASTASGSRAASEQPSGGSVSGGATVNAVTARVHQLAREGNLSKAVQCLDRSDDAAVASDKHSVNEQELEALRLLHPAPLASGPTPAAATAGSTPPASDAGSDAASAQGVGATDPERVGSLYPTASNLRNALHTFRVCLRRLKRRSAAGLSGWKLEHVLHRQHNHHVLPLLSELAWRVASGQVPMGVQAYMFGARHGIVPVPKGAGGGVRPIAIGELFVKMAAKQLAMGPVVLRATDVLQRHLRVFLEGSRRS